MFHNYAESGPSLLGDSSRKLHASFRLFPSNTTIANTLRRQILVATPTVAFRTEPAEESEVHIETNTTPLMNEMLAHRIGMIPVRADPHTFQSDAYVFVIEKENDTKGRDKKMMDVCASDFQIYQVDPANPLEEGIRIPTEQFFPPDPITGNTCLITRLRAQWNPAAPNEKLVLRAKASVSTGAENIRWSPVSQCSFENTLDEDPERAETMFRAWIAVNKKIPDIDSLAPEKQDELRREYKTMEIQRCFRVDEKGEPNDFTFHLESVGVRTVPECVSDALRATIEKLTRYQDLDNELPANVSVRSGDTQFPSVDIWFQDEEHTLGNLLQHYLVERHVEGLDGPLLTYAGYKVPHPLKKEMFVRVGVNVEGGSEAEANEARLAVAKVVRHLKELFEGLLGHWNTISTA
jgi:DNA-directed RNA polymerase subunit L/DNA-directed RNA polymerase alpha subunit